MHPVLESFFNTSVLESILHSVLESIRIHFRIQMDSNPNGLLESKWILIQDVLLHPDRMQNRIEPVLFCSIPGHHAHKEK